MKRQPFKTHFNSMLQLTQDNNLKEALFSSTYLYENLIKSTSHVEADTGSHREFFYNLLQERLILEIIST